ncbi:MAG: chemotaxis protein CheA [Nannocystis sp.]|uniref:chemotaxis protein CheA n=1 Tax=Nannocystis sp. TaxID=1962667 RepID=UPI0024251979|nr:chemotaxis protein CheA [Nannocystis sp.]MBK9753815.1 chemotaxis protein CheA [Nannocystis sp.]
MSSVDQNASEFIAEAQEVIETFSRTLLELEAQSRTGSTDPDLLNAAFRAIHSLKGLAGLFGAAAIGGLSHTLESTLDSLRLGKLGLGRVVLDVLFEAIEMFGRLLTPRDETDEPEPDIEPILARLRALTEQEAPELPQDNLEWVGEAILSVLTEYEEHRLRENIRSGRGLFRVHAKFDILAIDVGIEQLKDKMKLYGEVITYLPSADGSSDDAIELDILLGSKSSLAELSSALAVGDVTVHRLAAAEASSVITPAPAHKPASPAPASPAPASPAPGRAAAPPPTRTAAASAPPPRPAAAPPQTPARRDPEPAPAPARAPVARGPVTPAPSRREPAPVPLGDDAPVEAASSETSLRSLSQTVRVDLRRLDLLMNLVGELGLVQNNLAGVLESVRQLDHSADVSRELSVQIRDMTRKLALLQQGILDVRMVPIGQVFDKLARVVRKLSRDLDKEIRLVISGAETVLDKLIVEELSDPLMHMIRNCIDHGIEPAGERARLGKQPAGRIELRAFQKGNRVVIEVEDDGGGIDWLRIRDMGVRRGLVSAEEAVSMTPSEAINLIFSPGFSIREHATEVSGRGVGMDIVKTNIAKLSGMIDVTTEVGRGTKFAITLPVTLAIIQALVIQSAGHTFCIPLNSVLESIMVEVREISTIEGHEVIILNKRTLPLLYLSRLFALRPLSRTYRDPNRVYVVVVGLAQHRVGLVVDELLGQQDVVIKPLGSAVRNVPGIAGATELGANRTVLLLDVGRLVDEGVRQADAAISIGGSLGGSLGGSGGGNLGGASVGGNSGFGGLSGGTQSSHLGGTTHVR